jgi:putative long chain acyl-CoA synthase
MASVGSALAAGARLALTERFDPARFESEVRRSGATLVFYAGDMLRPLVHRKTARGAIPVRMFAGSGMRKDLARKLDERFGTQTIEFYAGTTHRAILANVDKRKPGALGRILPGSDPLVVAKVDLATKTVSREELAKPGELGVLAVRDGDSLITTNDVVRRDEDGDFWFVDSLSGFVGLVSTRAIEDVFYEKLDVDVAAAYPVKNDIWVAYVGTATPDDVRAALEDREQPRVVVRLDEIPLTDGFRPKKSGLPRTQNDPRVRAVVRRTR